MTLLVTRCTFHP